MKSEYIKEYGRLEVSHWWFAVRKKIILQSISHYVSPRHNLTILNIGAAAGASSKWLEVFGKVRSVENETLFVEHLLNNNIDVINASAEKLPFEDNSFDMVCAFDVIEHIEEDKNALEEMKRVCRPGGKVCITVPAYQYLWGSHDVVNGHKRRYSFSSFKQKIPTQLVIKYSTYFNTLLFIPILLARKMQRLFGNKNIEASDFENFKQSDLSAKICRFIFGLELPLLKMIRLPFGVSLLVLLEKNISDQNKDK